MPAPIEPAEKVVDLTKVMFLIDASIRHHMELYKLGAPTVVNHVGEDSYLRWWNLTLKVADPNRDGEETVVGRAEIAHFEQATLRDDFYELMDAIDVELAYVAAFLRDEDTGMMRADLMTMNSGDLWLVSHVWIDRPYRRHQLSHLLVHEGLRLLNACGYVALVPMPTEGPRNKTTIGQLRKQWRQAGFRPTPGAGGKVWGSFADVGYLTME